MCALIDLTFLVTGSELFCADKLYHLYCCRDIQPEVPQAVECVLLSQLVAATATL